MTITGTSTLTLVSSAGLSDNGAAAHTIAAPMALGTAQTWTVSGANAADRGRRHQRRPAAPAAPA